MKKFLALLLASLMLLTACNGGSNTSEPSGEGEYNGETRYTLISEGKPYVTTAEPNENYIDIFGQQLTDGQKTPDNGVHYTDTRMVGYTKTTNFIVDLGEDGKRISAVSARCLQMATDGVRLAASVRFSGSTDGKNYENIATVPFRPNGDQTVSTARYELKELKDYRYIKALIALSSDAAFFFIDEIEVFACVPEVEKVNVAEMAYKADNTDKNAWKSLSTGNVAKPVYTNNIAQGAGYKFNDCDFDERAPKNDKYLTDAAHTGRLFGQDVWVGIKGAEEKAPSVTVALGNSRDDIFSVKVHALGSGLGVEYPAYIDVYGADGGDEVYLGRMYAPAESANYAYTLILPEYIKAKLLRFEFPKGLGNYWIEEIEVFAGSDKPFSNVLYPPLDFDEVTIPVYWEETEVDYKEEINLIGGVIQQVASSKYEDAAVDATQQQKQSPSDFPKLTDGKLARSGECYNGDYFYSKGGGALDFIYDIGAISSVKKLNVNLLERGEYGISRPKHIYIYLSENGDDWYKVAAYDRSEDEEVVTGVNRMEFPFELETAYQARYVMFRFESAFLFVDELECFGTKSTDGAVKLEESGIKSFPYYINEESEKYATAESTGFGAEEITITYPNDTTVENLLPILAYIDEEGNIKDTFSDGLLLCYRGPLPSGNLGHAGTYMTDWEHALNSTFDDQTGFTVIDETVGTIKETLGLTDYKVKVYISVLTLVETSGEFGDVDGDGVNELASVPEDRKKIFSWFVNKGVDEFKSRNYENIELGGFYWLNEAVNWEMDDAHIITECGDVMEELGQNFFWVPYYVANRFYNGYEYGFDLISMQPNYVFDLEYPYYRITHTPDVTKRMGMTVEIEHTYQCLSDIAFARRYMLYLYYGVTEGYMNSVHVYYDDVENFGIMANSDSKLSRLQYDATYHFAKGDLDITPDKKEDLKLSVANETILYGNIGTEGEIELFSLVSSPENGNISLNTDGSFAYYPNKGFSGVDKFTYTYNNLLGESEECVVEITVG